MLTDLAEFYHQSIAEIIKIPRRFRRLMINNIPRIQARRQILDSSVAMFPTLSQESRDEQMGIWQRIAKILGFAGSAIEQVLWEGTVPDDLPPNIVVAEDWDTVMNFMKVSGAMA